eukprot:m.34884 g.34884  ORF g.34884 m.34884 type:complete len:113 (-) comp5200_c0_seq2:354-692(-)
MDTLLEDEELTARQVADKVQQYEYFLNEKLRTDLRKVLERRDAVYTDIAEYSKLATVIKTIKDTLPKLEDGKLQAQVAHSHPHACSARVPTMPFLTRQPTTRKYHTAYSANN